MSSHDDMNDRLWRAAELINETGGDWSRAKDHILSLVFLRFLSEWQQETIAEYRRKYRNDELRVRRAMSRERFLIPDGCSFQDLLTQRTLPDLGQRLNTIFKAIEDTNPHKLTGVFDCADFNSPELGHLSERNSRIRNLLTTIATLDCNTSNMCPSQWIGALANMLIAQFAEESARRREAYYTPKELVELMTKLVVPVPGDRIYDPACGSGGLLVHAARFIKDSNFALYGHERYPSIWALCKMNLAFQDMDAAHIIKGDPIRNPALTENADLQQFQVILSDPPFSTEWDLDNPQGDPFNRFKRGIPPRSSGDYTFISHIVETMDSEVGRACTVVPLGALFRGGNEGLIRRRLIEEGLLEGVMRLPANLFFGTAIPAALLLFRAKRTEKSVFFIDASQEFAIDKNRNRLRQEDIQNILETWKDRKEISRYSRLVSFEEIVNNEFNLSVSRYIEAPVQEVNLAEVIRDLARLEKELSKTRAELSAALNRLCH